MSYQQEHRTGPPPTGNLEATAGRRQKKRHRPSVKIGLWLIKRIERVLVRYSRVPDQPVLANQDFPWVQELEANWKTIRRELQGVLQDPERIPSFQEISRDQLNLTQDDRWKTFFLYGYGYRTPANCDRCPETTRLVESIPGMMTAFFSILAPGKHIPPHRGPYKGLVRCHLALVVPEPREQCRIRIGDVDTCWQEGRCLLFDDTYRHSVRNDTDGTRVVLFLDVRRPLRPPGSLLNALVLTLIRWSPFIRDARRNQIAWERRLGD